MNEKYCTFIDVLGYGSIVTDETKSQKEKLNILKSIYENLAFQLKTTIKEANSEFQTEIFIKSFSDCFYLECKELVPLLYALKEIYKNTFNFYSEMPANSEYTPLIRGGLVKEWTFRFDDLASVTNNNDGLNPVGLGVAKSYWTSEKSNLSGMRLLITEKVMNELELNTKKTSNYVFQRLKYTAFNTESSFHFHHIKQNEKKSPVNLYELIWAEELLSSCTYSAVKQLENLEKNFNTKSMRHFQKTAEVLLKGLELSDCKESVSNTYDKCKKSLTKMTK